MNPRERFIRTFGHKEPDKVPVGLGINNCNKNYKKAYHSLREYLGMLKDEAPVIYHRQMDTVYPKEDLWQLFEIDFRPLYMKTPSSFKPREMDDDSFYDELNIIWRRAGYYYDIIEYPLAGCESLSDLIKATAKWLDPYNSGRIDGLKEEAKQLYEDTDFCLVADIMCAGPFAQACFLRGHEQFLIDLYWNLPFAKALLERITERNVSLWDSYLGSLGSYVQVVCQGDDLGMQDSTYISPEMYRKFIKPQHQQLFSFIHSKTKAKLFLHTCGSIYDIIPDLIEIGVDILNPIQTSAAKMELDKLKKEFGKDLVFWGRGV